MELRQLEYFVTLVQYKSFTKTSQVLYVTQPTVSTAIKNLEKELGAELFLRGSGQFVLTEEGERLLPYAREMLRLAGNVADEFAQRHQNRQGSLLLGIPPMSCGMVYALVLGDFCLQNPHVCVHIQDLNNLEVVEGVLQDEIDLGFFVLPDSLDPGLDVLPLASGKVEVIAHKNHAIANREAVPIEEILSEPVIMYKAGTSYVEKRLRREFALRGAEPNIRHYFGNTLSIFNLVASGYGIGFVLSTEATTIRSYPDLIVRGFTEPVDYTIGLAWKKNKFLSTSARAMIQFFADSKAAGRFRESETIC